MCKEKGGSGQTGLTLSKHIHVSLLVYFIPKLMRVVECNKSTIKCCTDFFLLHTKKAKTPQNKTCLAILCQQTRCQTHEEEHKNIKSQDDQGESRKGFTHLLIGPKCNKKHFPCRRQISTVYEKTVFVFLRLEVSL